MKHYVAHVSPDGERKQSVRAHVDRVARLAAEFATPFGAHDAGYLAGLYHDIGKCSPEFQRRILENGPRCDHSTAGAKEIMELYPGKKDAVFLAACIAGHHAGLPNGDSRGEDGTRSLMERIRCKEGEELPSYSQYAAELDGLLPTSPPRFREGKHSYADDFFFTHMLYSCLVDADFLDTEAFMSEAPPARGGYDTLPALLDRFTEHTAVFSNPTGELNCRRTEILQSACCMGKQEKRGLFRLTVPTGGGKTLSSMAFALHHAVKHKMSRVIYVIPYTGIIEQTEEVFEGIFSSENVLGHYANAEFYTGAGGEEHTRHILAAENWDAPIVLTTAVRFFEGFYANRSSACRRLHNIANSVIVFDEVQTLPPEQLKPCLLVISQLVKNYGCSALLCTATQPALDRFFREREMLPDTPITEICPHPDEMYEFFRRVDYREEGKLTAEELADRLLHEQSVLCILGTRAKAADIYTRLPTEGSYHLSTNMTPRDRRRVLAEVRERLKNREPCRVVSTSLVEAGVDLDFPAVYRELAGLDSLIQAGGRCNREGRRRAEESTVHIFRLGEPSRYNRQSICAAEYVLRNFDDIASREAIQSYFARLYTLRGDTALDSKDVFADATKKVLRFAEVAKNFRMIESSENYSVIVPYPDTEETVAALLEYGPTRKILRKLGPCVVNMRKDRFEALLSSGALTPVDGYIAILSDPGRYDPNLGFAPSRDSEFSLLEF